MASATCCCNCPLGAGQAPARSDTRPTRSRRDRAELLRYGDANGDGWADVIDTLSMYPDVRPQVVRLLGEINPDD
jgi:hypothetical protein